MRPQSGMMTLMPREHDIPLPREVRCATEAFSTPLRVALVQLAGESGGITFHSASEALGVPTATARNNIDALEALGVLQGLPAREQRKGRSATFTAMPGRVSELLSALHKHLSPSA